MQFYENFVRLCAQSGKSLAYVAREVGVQKSTVSRWASGSVPRDTTLARLAVYFGITVDELVGNSKVETQESESKNTAEDKAEDLAIALEALRNQPGRRALLSATKNMTEAQVLRMADWIADLTGGNKD